MSKVPRVRPYRLKNGEKFVEVPYEIATHKVCSKCFETKELIDFFKTRKQVHCYCKNCHLNHSRKDRNTSEAYNSEEKKKARFISNKKYVLKRTYNITLEQFEEMKEQQNWCCYICGIQNVLLKSGLMIDHDHITKKVRKLLCTYCNSALGMVGENIYTLEKMINYIKEHDED